MADNYTGIYRACGPVKKGELGDTELGNTKKPEMCKPMAEAAEVICGNEGQSCIDQMVYDWRMTKPEDDLEANLITAQAEARRIQNSRDNYKLATYESVFMDLCTAGGIGYAQCRSEADAAKERGQFTGDEKEFIKKHEGLFGGGVLKAGWKGLSAENDACISTPGGNACRESAFILPSEFGAYGGYGFTPDFAVIAEFTVALAMPVEREGDNTGWGAFLRGAVMGDLRVWEDLHLLGGVFMAGVTDNVNLNASFESAPVVGGATAGAKWQVSEWFAVGAECDVGGNASATDDTGGKNALFYYRCTGNVYLGK